MSGPERCRPIDSIVISTIGLDGKRTDHGIEGEAFGMGSLDHNVATAEVTITFVNVQALEVFYRDFAQPAEPTAKKPFGSPA